MMFEGWRVPDDDSQWVNYLGDVLTPPYALRRQGDDRPLDWVSRFLAEHPERADAIGRAYVAILAEGHPERCGQILEQLPSFPADLSAGLTQLLVQHHAALQTIDPLKTDQTLLGGLVRVLDRVLSGPPTDVAADILASIDRVEDGLPESFLLALRARFAELRQRLVPLIQKLPAAQVEMLARRLVNEPPPVGTESFDEIGKNAPGYLRERIGKAIKEYAQPPDPQLVAAYRQIASGKNWPAPNTGDRWPDLARRLGVKV